MSTKLRSACDRCHENKIRCSGNIPCQNCFISGTLCFYSLSQPLGRPKGTKKNKARKNSSISYSAKENNAVDAGASETQAELSDQKTSKKRNRPGQRSSAPELNDGYNATPAFDPVAMSSKNVTVVPLGLNTGAAGAAGATDDLSIITRNYDVPMMDANEFRHGSISPPEPALPDLDESLSDPFGFSDFDNHTIPALSGSEFSYSAISDMSRVPSSRPDLYNMDNEGSLASAQPRGLDLQGLRTAKDSVALRNDTLDDVSQLNHQLNHSRSGTASSGSIHSLFVQNRSLSTTSPVSRSLSTMGPGTRVCFCFQKHAEVLSNPILSESRADDSSPEQETSMDKALQLVGQAVQTWQGLLDCANCLYGNDQEAMLLAFMSIRGVVRYLQRLTPFFTNAEDIMVPNSGSSSHLTRLAHDEIPLRIGTFELQGSDRLSVLKFLYKKALEKVRNTLHSLQLVQNKTKQRLMEGNQNKSASADDYHASSNLYHIQQMSYGLTTALQNLESSLNE